MTTKQTKAVTYKLSDFFTKDIAEKATKMPLMYDGNDTGCFLMVKGIDAKSVQRARIIAQVGYADAAEDSEKIEDKTEKAEFTRDVKEKLEIDLAIALVVDWSFGDADSDVVSTSKITMLLEQNQGLAFAVIAHSTTPSNYLVKK